jgi:class 3 adenylate cyclase
VAAPLGEVDGLIEVRLRAQLLGPFAVTLGERRAGPWRRPPARRLCQLVLVSPGRRISRPEAIETLFPQLGLTEGGNALSQSLSYARAALAALGAAGPGLVQANRAHIWGYPAAKLELDLDLHQEQLRLALEAAPGLDRDRLLCLGLVQDGVLLADEPHAEWAAGPRERLEWARQEARLTLARDRSSGFGRSEPEAVVQAWEACLTHEPTSEEAAAALMRVYGAQRRHAMVEGAYRRCHDALAGLGLKVSPALGALWASTATGRLLGTLSGPAGSAGSAGETFQESSDGRLRAERRLVSVLFVELTGPLSAGPKLGPEDMHEMLGGALADMVGPVEAYGGTVTSLSGAGLVALFGAPAAHEDDPERAVRAALSVVSGTFEHTGVFSVRAGVETGECVVGPLLPGVGHYGALGDPVSTAAALQSVAKPSSVLVGPSTRAATDTLFLWGPSEEVSVPPGTKPLTATYLERPRARPAGQAGRRRLAGSAPLVGREPELEALRGAVRQTTAGQGGIVLVASEPGLGKTRLVQECRRLFMSWVSTGSGRLPLWLEGRAASYAASHPYGLYRQLLLAWLGVTPEQGEHTVRGSLERATRAVFGGQVDMDGLSLLSAVLGLAPTEADAHVMAGRTPEQLQRATFRALRGLVGRLVAHGPTVLALEDLHWADPTSLLVTRELVALAKESPLLLVLTRRPEPDPGVSALEGFLHAEPGLSVRTLLLGPLEERHERRLASGLLGDELSNDVLAVLLSGVEGNPLFLEERVASLLETQSLVPVEDMGWRLDDSVPYELPAAIDRLVRSRVDRLPSGLRDVLVGASVLGPEFNFSALAAVAGRDGELLAALGELCSAALLVETGQVPEPTYRFRHALVQEGTYKLLLREERCHLHARAAWGLEAATTGRLEEVAGILGHHFAMAGEEERAGAYLVMAGDGAANVFANEEAVASYRYALDVLSPCSPSPADRVVEIWLKLGEVYWRMALIAEARTAFRQAADAVPAGAKVPAATCYCWLGNLEAQSHQHGDAFAWFDLADELLGEYSVTAADNWVSTWLDVQLGRVDLYYWRFDPERAAGVLDRARPILEERGSSKQRANFLHKMSAQRAQASHYVIDREAVDYMRAAWEAAVEGGLSHELYWMRFELAFMLLWHGDLDGAHRELGAALDLSRQAGDKTSEMRCLVYLAFAHLLQGNVEVAGERASQSEALAGELEFPEYVGAAQAIRGWVAWREHKTDEATLLCHRAMRSWSAGVIAYPFKWPALFPLLAIYLTTEDVAGAIEVSRQLTEPGQLRLGGGVESALEAAIVAAGRGRGTEAKDALCRAVTLAKSAGYL